MNKFKRAVAFKFDTKAIEKDGSFAGYASVFGNVDSYRDVVMPGAFGKTLAAYAQKGSLPPVLWQHQPSAPIGTHTKMVEDGTGLAVEGQLLVGQVQQATETHALIKAGVVRGMSIGYDLYDDGWDYDADNGILLLTGIDLWENSIVTFPANDQALVSEVKYLMRGGNMPPLSVFEKAMRDAMGLSKSVAAAIAGGGYKRLLEQSESESSDQSKSRGESLPSVEDVCSVIANFKF